MSLDLDVPLHLHPLRRHVQGDAVTVGRPDTDVYISLPPDGAALLDRLVHGDTPSQAADWYAGTFGSQVDIEAFVTSLRDTGFVSRGVVRAPGADSDQRLRGRRLGHALFGPLAWAAYASVICWGIWVLVTDASVRPSPALLRTGPSITGTYLLVTAGLLPFLAVHEAFHTLAGRRLGLRSSTHVSHRFVFLVVETRLDGLVALPRSRRILPILAGPMIDLVAFFALTGAAHTLAPGTSRRVMLTLAYALMMRVIWQFYFCMQTDIYALVAVLLGTHDLHGASRWRIGRWVYALVGKRSRLEENAWSRADLRHSRWYAPVIVVGYGLLLLGAALAVLPAFLALWHRAIADLAHHTGSPAVSLDAAAFVLVNLVQVVLAVTLFVTQRRRSTTITTAKESLA